ncbi:hypothetical protein HPP92_015699 [Vanilla planifolia]|uniref:K+ potassium transporter integral membrane domain-containing protein n=1 Tax=Vanilla planifolia TaxID=51239 RepID=A0A835QM66_VANPL|nr:hypothetical protein HPP92_015699 [Vanilla planifolia]
MDPESESSSSERCRMTSFRRALLLAYQSLGVVYGDLSISPIYVFSNTFSGKMMLHVEDTEIMGVLSLAFWTLTLIVLFKYIIIVLGADDNGEGGTLALYSKLCSNSKIGLINKQFNAQVLVSSCESASNSTETSMLVGDGVLTPTISVLAAVSGIRVKVPELNEKYAIFTACVILVGLFALQHYGTHRIGFLFAPVPICWLGCIVTIGIYNILTWNPLIMKALSPHYIYKYFKDTGQDGWRSLGGVVLCITGAEAMFADLGHFSKLSLRMAFATLVYPSLVLAYLGEAAYISKHKENLQTSFYRSIPGKS